MKLNVTKEITEDIIKVQIDVAEMGTNSISSEEEIEMVHDFVKTFCYRDIEFKGNMKLDAAKNPVITDTSPDGSTIAEVELELINKEFVIDENLSLTLLIDTKKIDEDDLVEPFNTVESLGKARAELYIQKVQEEISKKLKEIRELATTFEGEEEVIL